MEDSITQPTDSSVREYLEAPEGREADEALGKLLHVQAAPIARRILWRRGGRISRELDDLVSGVLLRLLARLRVFKVRGLGPPISDFAGYVAGVTHRAYSDYLRRASPERQRLRRKLEYLLGNDSRFARWRTDQGDWHCGLAEWRPPLRDPPAGRSKLRDGVTEMFAHALDSLRDSRTDGADALHVAFVVLGCPLSINDLLGLAGSSWGGGIRGAGRHTLPPEPVSNPVARLDDRLFLHQLWKGVLLLPVAQRTALLLNLRDAPGRDLLGYLPMMGTASIREIAQALEMGPEDLAGLWKRLPLDDHAIADRLGLTRQQVINLRLAARRRLARRFRPEAQA
jgi:DNA-directed RNA polymerase specialized sigma24 family protein